MKKTELTAKELNEIKRLYSENKLSIKKVSKLTQQSTSVIYRILQENNLIQSKTAVEPLNTDNVEFINRDFKSKKGYKFVAVCKKTGNIFNDYTNVSGALTNHIKKTDPDCVIPTGFLRRQYKSRTGRYWHENFFDIKEIEDERSKLPTKKCAYCEWTTIDIENKSGAYIVHLKDDHNISVEEHLKSHPEEKDYFNTYQIRMRRQNAFKDENIDYVYCKICNEKIKRMTNTHLKKHNITMIEYKLKYPEQPTLCQKSLEIQQKIYNEGLKHIGNNFTSRAQIEINNIINNANIKTILNDKKLLKGTEIDILIPEKNIGIEYNGCLYHSELYGKKPRQFHKYKTDLMNRQSYGLIHIFEDEWEFNKEIVISKIKHTLRINDDTQKIHARKCIIKEIDSDIKNGFLNKNHIQGQDMSNVHIGAFYEEKLISIMTFDNLRQMNIKNNDEKTYELKRFCVDIKCSVPGIANRLLSFFIQNYKPEKIISFADRRWTLNKDNNLYTKLGFNLIETTEPDYTYYNPGIHRHKRLHKFGFGKNSLKKKYPEIYDENKTEWQMMQELGFDRIWDCGKFKYEMIINQPASTPDL